jgi:succinate dehydrogenase / fumarate reductase membrane anchor subunit
MLEKMATITTTTERRVYRQSDLERYAFLFMRLSGVALLVLAVGHMFIQHVFNSSTNLTIQFAAQQWRAWGWKVYDMLLLIFAVVHGMNGLRYVLEDYVHNRSLVKAINIFLAIFTVVTLIWAGIAIAYFDPAMIR